MSDTSKAILCVDDEANILSSLKRLLRKEDYTLYTANSAREGLELLKEHEVQVVLSDQRMPEKTGVEFLKNVKELYPSTIRVVLSGYADLGAIVEAINQGEIFRFLTKPWNDENLKADIRQCFEHYEIVQQNHHMINVIKEQNKQLQEINEHLEQQVTERTKSLLMSQDILEKLPQPVLGISSEYQVIIVNDAASEKFPELQMFFPGTTIDELLPEVVCAKIRLVAESTTGCTEQVQWDGKPTNIKLQPLISAGEMRGVIVVTE